jgi:PAS domain S-box-containing protein
MKAPSNIQDGTPAATAAVSERSEQLLRIASRVARIGGWALDLVAFTVSWSDEVCEIHGVPPGYVPTLDVGIAFYAPEYRERIRDSVRDCVNDKAPFDFEAQIINIVGERVWVRVVGEAQVDRDGAVIGVAGALQDISERVKAIEALRASDQRFRLVAQATSDVVWDWNIVDDTCWWGDGLQTKFGYTNTGRLSPRFWADNLHPDDRDRVLNSIYSAIAAGRVWSDEYRFRKADGTYAQVVDRAVVAFDVDGRASRMLGAMVDVTQQRILETRLDAVQRLSTLGQLAANMAHEFNNVLMGIQPFVEVLRRLTLDVPKAQNATERIVQSIRRGKDITNAILQATQRAGPISQPIDVRDWLRDFASEAGALGNAISDTERLIVPMSAADAARLPKKVLIVDDEPAVNEGISMLLAAEGLQSASIFEGGGAIAAIEQHAPELVLLDIGLPDISGVDVFHRIHEQWPELRVILMTGHYSRSDLGPILAMPQVGFLQKPFGVAELRTALET